ncbi:MAG: hypothetical protein ACK45G_12455, partial [Bacteroidota bacterium]
MNKYMSSTIKLKTLLSAVFVLFFLSASAQMNEAQKAYQNENYRLSSTLFASVCKQEPANAEAFY